MSLQIQTAQVALMETEESAFEKKLRAEIHCAPSNAQAGEMTAAPFLLCLQIHAVNLDTQDAQLLVSQTHIVQTEWSDEAFVLEFGAPGAGRYQLRIVAFLLNSAPQIAFRCGPLLRVEAEKLGQFSDAPNYFEEGADSESEAHFSEAESSVQKSKGQFDNAVCAGFAHEKEFLFKERISLAPANQEEELALANSGFVASLEITGVAQSNQTQPRFPETAPRPRFYRLSAVLQIPLQYMSLIGLIVLGFSFPFRPSLGEQQTDLLKLERNLQRLQAIAQSERERNADLKKILAIIDRYAPEMHAEVKFEIADTIHEMTIKYSNLDLELICATITHETGRSWNPRSISPVRARGLMQIMPLTGEMLASAEGIAWSTPEKILFDPLTNLRLGCRYLSALVQAYSIDGGLAAYNGGEKRAELWLRQGRAAGILANETSYYVPSILKLYAEYRRMRG